MFRNYFKTACRNILKSKAFSLINIFGLAIGISVFLIITLFVADEFSYDAFHEKADQIYRIPMHVKFGETDISVANTSPILGESLEREFPEVLESTRIFRDLKYVYKGNDKLREVEFFFADSTIFDVFTINLIQGNPQTALANPSGVVLTEDIARKYFGNESSIGKLIRTTDGMELTVTGIAESMPENSLFEFDFLASIYTQPESRSDEWLHNFAQTYFVLEEKASWRELENKLPAFIEQNVSNIMSIPYQAFKAAGNKFEYFLQPLKSIHLTPGVYNEFKNAGDVTILYFLSAIALFILLIACINFINLSTARSTKRANEIGVRKVLGSRRGQLINQFLAETILLTFVAVILALVIIEIFSPIVGSVADKNLGIDYISDWYVIPLLILFTIIVGIVAGIYPSFFITSFQPVQALKGKIYKGKKGIGIRKGLVVFQFAVSIILIIATSIVLLQMNYIRNKDLGYDKEQIFLIQNADILGEQLESFKNTLLTNYNILNTASSNSLQNHDLNLAVYKKDDGSDQQFTPVTLKIDDNFIETYKFQFVEGRSFSKLHAGDSLSIILNETAVRMLGYNSPLERRLILDTPDEGTYDLHIIGVVKDFHTQQMHEVIRPAVFILSHDNDMHFLSIKLSGVNIVESVDFIKAEWEKFAPSQPMDFVFFDESFDRMYEAEIRTSKLFSSFAILAIIIACLGLFGLITFSAEQRTKEIGIRKVMGSSVMGIVILLSKEFANWILIANLIAWPIAYFLMKEWLQNFAYKTEINLLVFLAAGMIIFIISLITVSYQTIRAATSNPVHALRYE